MRKMLMALLLLVSLVAMTATVAYADGKPMLPDERSFWSIRPGTSLR